MPPGAGLLQRAGIDRRDRRLHRRESTGSVRAQARSGRALARRARAPSHRRRRADARRGRARAGPRDQNVWAAAIAMAALDIGDGAGHFATDQVQLADLLEARLNPVDLPLRVDRSQDVAAVDEADERDIAGVGNLVREQYVRDTLLRLLLDLAVDGRVAAGAEDPEELSLPGAARRRAPPAFRARSPESSPRGWRMPPQRRESRSRPCCLANAFLARDPGQRPVEQWHRRSGVELDDHQAARGPYRSGSRTPDPSGPHR